MKKIIVSTLMIMFAATAASYATIYTSQAEGDESYGGIYSNHSVDAEENDSGFGLYRSSDPDPGGRPGSGGGIGQEDVEDVPSGDGLTVLIACSVLLIVVKLLAKQFRRTPVLQVFPDERMFPKRSKVWHLL